MANVLVVGSSRGIGLETVRQALNAGHSVRAFARTAARIGVDDARLETHQGDARNRDDLIAALAGIDTVILVLGVPAGPQLVLGPIDLFSAATRAVLAAMKEAGVTRLICVTGLGAGDSLESIGCLQRIPFRLILGRAYDDKSIQEQLIRDSAVDWVVARPVILTNGPKTGRYRVLAKPREWRNGLISRADVADFLVKQIENDTYLGQAPVLCY